ncbi:MAG: MoxR family ATPase [Chloroflexia bacterium]|nr:MoxR family ATPase [Chloroflexia bacterium]
MSNHIKPLSAAQIHDASTLLRRIVHHIEQVIVGQRAAIDFAVITLAARGHLLIEDVPGTGKTMLARTLARTLGCSFARIQLTPDLLPADITGSAIFNPRELTFNFHPGPIHAQIVLADELNRATPRTQSALLEAMEERQITVDGTTHPLPAPFMVIATQNPIEYDGTFTLPEAQLDRFSMRIRLGYPSHADELTVLQSQRHRHPIDSVTAYTNATDIIALQQIVQQVYVDPAIDDYIVTLGGRTRQHNDITLGASTRALLALTRVAQARALLGGRGYVLPDDVQAIAVPVLAHRLILAPAARMRNDTAEQLVSTVVTQLSVTPNRHGWRG